MTVEKKTYHYNGALIPASHIRPSFTSVFVRLTRLAKKSALKERQISEHLSRNILFDSGTEISQASHYAQIFQILRKWVQQDTPNSYDMVINADKHPVSAHVRWHNGRESFEVVAIITEMEDREEGSKDIVGRNRGSINQINNHVSDKICNGHRSHDPLIYEL